MTARCGGFTLLFIGASGNPAHRWSKTTKIACDVPSFNSFPPSDIAWYDAAG
jgi:hypothetical protein